jgi:prepilin-type processing-associated H-X9-DG protein
MGILAARSQVSLRSLACASMAGSVNTWFDGALYQYSSTFPWMLGATTDPPLTGGDGRSFTHVAADPGTTVTAAICSYSYRDTPFYSRMTPDNAPAGWTYGSDYPDLSNPDSGWLAQWTLALTRPAARVQFMCPPFKTIRALGTRSIAADGFDYAPSSGGAFTVGIGMNAHKDGYNVLYGDGHAAWYADDQRRIAKWNTWADPANPGSDNLTISSASSQLVWNQFDQAAGVDCP